MLSGSGGNQQIADGERSHLPGVSTIYQYIYDYMGMEQIKNIPIWGDEYPFSSYFGLHQGCRILTDDR